MENKPYLIWILRKSLDKALILISTILKFSARVTWTRIHYTAIYDTFRGISLISLWYMNEYYTIYIRFFQNISLQKSLLTVSKLIFLIIISLQHGVVRTFILTTVIVKSKRFHGLKYLRSPISGCKYLRLGKLWYLMFLQCQCQFSELFPCIRFKSLYTFWTTFWSFTPSASTKRKRFNY